ncbi:Rv3235 family protein [Umezawaea beigongshangensis]|uniref:Rv3235 family protein n=1 Tax=Umezawaea beigongshangensis TaxID=2780383 RepID=UPI0018F1C333|nr:Rv3235 family protein [Umezawaea beigongshangensis]
MPSELVRLRPLAHYEPPTGTVPRQVPSGVREPVRTGLPADDPLPRPDVDPARLVAVVLEALDGRRPVAQLRGLLSDDVLLWVRARARRSDVPSRLRTVRVGRPGPDAVELCGTASCGDRVRALVARLERRDDRWRCTVFALLP